MVKKNQKSDFDKNLKAAFAKMKKGSHRGLVLATALVKRESQKRTPVDEGNLKGGHYTNVSKNKDESVGEIGTTAEYAIYVHEDLEAFHPTGEAKFLENAISENEETILRLIYDQAKL